MSAIAVENGYLIDPYAGICGKHTVRIENGTVSEAGNADGAVRIDADGLLVFPGLIDFHCHLVLVALRLFFGRQKRGRRCGHHPL